REVVIALDQEPVLPLLARLARHPHEVPASSQLLAVDLEIEMALGIAFLGIAKGRPRAPVPEDDRAPSVLALRDGAFEIAIVERMILDMDGETLLAGNQAWALGDRPALERAVHLEAQIVVQAARRVLLDQIGL